MKTIKEWLNELPEPYRTEALDLHSKSTLESKDSFVPNKHRAILLGFEWYEYKWLDLYDDLKGKNE